MAEKTTVARPYAKAAFEIAHEQDQLADWSAALAIAAAVAGSAELQPLLHSPHLSADELAELMLKLARDPRLGERLSLTWPAGRDEHCANFLHLLARRQRLPVLPQISSLFDQYKAEAENSVDVELRVADGADEGRRERIARALEQRLGRKVRIKLASDQELIGGAVVRAGDLVIDGSVRGKLERLVASMTH